jgi:hypothetical protein
VAILNFQMVQTVTTHLKDIHRNYNSKPNLAEMFSMRSYTRVVTFVQIRQKHGHHVTLKILIGRFSRNFFSRTAEEDEHVVSHRVSMQTLTSAGGHFEFSNCANSNNTC